MDIAQEVDKIMKENQNTPSVHEIESKYRDKKLYINKRERYQDQWQTSPIAQPTYDIIRVPFTYEIMRVALYVITTNALAASHKKFIINEKSADRLTQILKSITADISSRYNVFKGIYLFGAPSAGKTFIMKSIYLTLHKAYYTGWYSDIEKPYWYSYKDLMYRAREEKSIAFLDTIFRGKKYIFLDDLGYEEDMVLNLYGNKEIVIKHIVDILYKLYTDHDTIIHFTSNVEIMTIQEKYGQTTADRISEMATPVTWTSDVNLRKI